MVDFRSKVSPVIGISGGSMETSLHTFFNFLARRFLRWSCLPIVNPARGQKSKYFYEFAFSLRSRDPITACYVSARSVMSVMTFNVTVLHYIP